MLKTLLDRKLIAEGGRKAVVGKPILYKTTKEFLVQFGLNNLNELPTLKEFEELGRMELVDDAVIEGPSSPEEAAAQVAPETPALEIPEAEPPAAEAPTSEKAEPEASPENG